MSRQGSRVLESFFDLDRACREVFLFTGADAAELEQFLVASGDADHLLRVAHISWMIAKTADLDDPDRVWLCGLLHDIGKVAVSDSVVAKPCALTHDEKILMRKHVEAGCAIVAELIDDTSPELRRVVIDGIRCHHERWDGSGYPNGLAGSSIPIVARIVAVADVLDAVTSERVYKPAYGIEAGFAAVEEGFGSLFDPELEGVLAAVRQEIVEFYGDKTDPDRV